MELLHPVPPPALLVLVDLERQRRPVVEVAIAPGGTLELHARPGDDGLAVFDQRTPRVFPRLVPQSLAGRG